MLENDSNFSESFSKGLTGPGEASDMSDVLMAQESLRMAFAPLYEGEKDTNRIARAAQALQKINRQMGIARRWTQRRVRSLWYDEARMVRSHEMKVIEHAQQVAEAKKDYQDLHRLRERLEKGHTAALEPEVDTVRKMEHQAWRVYRALGGE